MSTQEGFVFRLQTIHYLEFPINKNHYLIQHEL